VPTRAGIFIPPFNELADPRLVAELGVEAEEAGWAGFFVWDHVNYRQPAREIGDPWVALAAIATRTERIRIGALVTPLARRRPHIVARQTASLDLLSGGRLVFGAGLGGDGSGRERSAFDEELDDRLRAQMLDEALDVITALWTGQQLDHDGPHFRSTGCSSSPPSSGTPGSQSGLVDAGYVASRSHVPPGGTGTSRSM
jgi:alkanesulfonate monooxygenase SsuD/methylene tetrahydromethanopterin reductase-like flavin-dependent oxidoreductase (luciferase family)